MRKIQDILLEWKKEAKAKRVVQFNYRNGILSIYTSECGYFIGLHGQLVDKYKNILKEELHDFEDIKFVETNYYWV